jgi:hypothetical protein
MSGLGRARAEGNASGIGGRARTPRAPRRVPTYRDPPYPAVEGRAQPTRRAISTQVLTLAERSFLKFLLK